MGHEGGLTGWNGSWLCDKDFYTPRPHRRNREVTVKHCMQEVNCILPCVLVPLWAVCYLSSEVAAALTAVLVLLVLAAAAASVSAAP